MPEQKLQDKGKTPGSPLWMAPEVLMGKPLDEKVRDRSAHTHSHTYTHAHAPTHLPAA